MKKILLLLTLLINSAFAEINEYKVDLVYSTDMILPTPNTNEERVWIRQVEELLLQYPDAYERVGDKKVAYHTSKSVAEKGITKLQNLEGMYGAGAFEGFKAIISKMFNLTMTAGFAVGPILDDIVEDVYVTPIEKQVQYYNERMESGHGIVVVAHSTGNWLTKKAFDIWDTDQERWKQKYLHVVSVGSSLRNTINNGKGVIFDNDRILSEYYLLKLLNIDKLEDYIEEFSQITFDKYIDVELNDEVDDFYTYFEKFGIDLTKTFKFVDHLLIKNPNRHDYIIEKEANAIGETQEKYIDEASIEYHKFEYYTGGTVMETTFTDVYQTQIELKPRQTDVAKKLIQQWVYDEIMDHGTRESHWMYDTNGSDHKVNLKHKFTGATFNAEIYPFNMDKGKVYILSDDNITYVKALYGGTHIDSNWTGQQPNEVYRLNNPEEEKVLSDRFKSDGSTVIDTETYLAWSNIDLTQYN